MVRSDKESSPPGQDASPTQITPEGFCHVFQPMEDAKAGFESK